MLRIGVLGAAKITRGALLSPARKIDDVSVVAVAARDPLRAATYARRHHIPVVFSSYEELLASDDIDAVYIPLPAALHGRWAIAALRAGRHVLVEKPFAANAEEAQIVAAVAGDTGLVAMEAFHSLPLRMLQALFGYDATVLSATASCRGQIDTSLNARLAFPGIPHATVFSSMWSHRLLGSRLEVIGTDGVLRVGWPFTPQVGGRLHVRTATGRVTYPVDRGSTYGYQLNAFRDSIRSGTPIASPLAESVAMMRTIDQLYEAAGMRRREPQRS
jgi:predicted dehydrogenase